MARKRKSKPTGKGRSRKQTVKDRYAHAREDAQLAGVIPTTPEEALRSERVDPLSQDSQRFPGLDRLAILNEGRGWSTPEHVKRKAVEQAAEVLFEKKTVFKTVTNPDGTTTTVEVVLPPDRNEQLAAIKVLLLGDQKQYERDNPVESGGSKGGSEVTVNVNNTNQVAVVGALDRLREEILAEDAAKAGRAKPLPDGDRGKAEPGRPGPAAK